MKTKARYKLVLVGGPNCGNAETYDYMATWPPPMFLYVEGFAGCYHRTRVSAEELSDLDYYMARYEWDPA